MINKIGQIVAGEFEPVTRIAVNLLVLTERPPGGTGFYAISLFEALVVIEREGRAAFEVIGFVQQGAQHHFSATAAKKLTVLPNGGSLTRVLNEVFRVPLHAKRAAIDVVINPAFFGVPWGSVRRLTVIHDLYFCRIPKLVSRRRRLLLKAITPRLARRSDHVIVVSAATQKDLAKFYPELLPRTAVIHSGNRILRVADDLPLPLFGRPFLLMVGALTANKAPEVVIAALSRLNAEGHDILLVHIGDDQGRLRPLAEAAGCAAKLVLMGRQPDDVLAAHYSGCLAMVIPSICEGFGLPLIEGQMHGAPVIASSCDALTEIGGQSAIYFDVESVDECAQAIRTVVLASSAEKKQLVQKGRTNAARFRWTRTAEQMLDVLGVPRRR